jgi:hypothetical protein
MNTTTTTQSSKSNTFKTGVKAGPEQTGSNSNDDGGSMG